MYPLILRKIIMPVANFAMSTKDMHYLKLISNMEAWPEEKIREWQNVKFLEIISHFYNNTEYYPRIFSEIGLSIKDIYSIEDLNKIPQIDKKIFNEERQSLLPKNLSTIKYKHSSTGGSSGDPLKFYLDLNSWSFTIANKIHNWEKSKYKYGDLHIALGSSSLFPESKSFKHKVFHWLKNEIPLNGMNMSASVINQYINLIDRKKIAFLYGYASSLFLLADYVLKNEIEINSVKVVFPTSEILTAHFEKTIKAAFNCEIVDSYGARDGGITAFKTNSKNYHVGYNSYILDDENHNQPQPIIITDLFNYAFPFINYNLGDTIELDRSESNRDYNGQIINHIYGRESDILYLDNGNNITGPGFTILFRDFNVVAYQIQKVSGLHIKCTIQKTINYSESEEKQIRHAIQKYIGHDCKLEIVYSTAIPIGKNGKVKYFIK